MVDKKIQANFQRIRYVQAVAIDLKLVVLVLWLETNFLYEKSQPSAVWVDIRSISAYNISL